MKLDTSEQKFLKKLGMRLRELRKEKGWTLEEAEGHGWPNWRHLQKMEAGKNITIITLYRAARLYRIDMVTLLDI